MNKPKNKKQELINTYANVLAYHMQDMLDNISHHAFSFNGWERDYRRILKDFTKDLSE